MRCEEYRAGLLERAESETMRAHAAGCADCRGLTPGLQAVAAALADAPLWEEPSPELERRVVSLIAGSSVRNAARTGAHRRRRAMLAATIASVAAIAVTVVAWAGLRGPGPDWVVPITGTDLAPQAVGVVKGWNTDAGTRVVFDVTGMDSAPSGFFYEVWFSRERVHVSAGSSRSIDGLVTNVGVARRDYPRIWVTIEPVDEDEGPSGATVLDTG